MRPIERTIELAAARAAIDRAIAPIERLEIVPLLEASGRVLARDIVAAHDVPPFARAAMDGYALRAADTAGATHDEPRRLRCIEQIFTGRMPERTIDAGTCAEVATGAPMPDGADAVVMVEQTHRDAAGMVSIFAPATPRQSVGARGADIATGQTALNAGELLNPARVGAIAALGIGEVEVYARPRVALLSTGDEIVEPGEPLRAGQIHDINKFTMATTFAEHGGVPVVHRTANDSIDELSRALDACLEADLVVFSGGTSAGERDLILDVLAARGEVLFHGISLKPGKPTAFALVGGTPVFGLPGYPTSCLTNAYLLVVPALRKLARLPVLAARRVTVPLAREIVAVRTRHQIYTVRVEDGRAVPAFKASGDITSMSQADGYIEIPAGTGSVAAGTPVEVTLF